MTKEDLQQIAELLKPIHEELTDLRAGQEELKANVSGLETEVRRTRMLVEMQDHKIGLIAEQYTDCLLYTSTREKSRRTAARVTHLETHKPTTRGARHIQT